MMKIAALLVLLVRASQSAVIENTNENDNKETIGHNEAETDQRNLFHHEENFWSRFVQVTSSSFPSVAPSSAPTGICIAKVSVLCVATLLIADQKTY